VVPISIVTSRRRMRYELTERRGRSPRLSLPASARDVVALHCNVLVCRGASFWPAEVWLAGDVTLNVEATLPRRVRSVGNGNRKLAIAIMGSP
jgi:hypothetical protein